MDHKILAEGDIGMLQEQIASWANEIFPDRTVFTATTKLILEEIPEWLRDHSDPHESADLVILILDIAYLKGIDVKKAVLEKMEINRQRKWERNPETGFMNHIKPKKEEQENE